MNIAIIGTGRIGQALDYLLKQNNIHAQMWDVVPDLPRTKDTVAETVARADLIFLGVPSWVLRDVATEVLIKAPKHTTLIALTKGIEPKTHKTADIVLSEVVTAGQLYGLLSGPMMAEEIIRDGRAAAVVAGSDGAVFSQLERVFVGTKLQLQWSDEFRAVALAAVLKNVYSLGMGIADGLGMSGNEKGMLFVRMVDEMMQLQTLLGGNPECTLSLGGIGDMVATAFSEYSRQRTSGEELITTGTMSKKSESVSSLPSLVALVKNVAAYPILQAVHQVVQLQQPASDVYAELLDHLWQ